MPRVYQVTVHVTIETKVEVVADSYGTASEIALETYVVDGDSKEVASEVVEVEDVSDYRYYERKGGML